MAATRGDGHGAWHPTQSRQGREHRRQPPRCDVLLQVLFETLAACVMCAHSADICLKDEVWNGRGTDHCRAPSQGGRAPMGPAHVPDIVSEQAGCETTRGVLQIAEGICTGAGRSRMAASATVGDIDGGERP